MQVIKYTVVLIIFPFVKTNLSFKSTDNVAYTKALSHVERCLNDILALHDHNMLKLNTDKSEVTVFASQRNAKFVENVSMTVGESNIEDHNA